MNSTTLFGPLLLPPSPLAPLTADIFSRGKRLGEYCQSKRCRQHFPSLRSKDCPVVGVKRDIGEASIFPDIAAAAGVKKALVQYHFATKEKLWKAAAAKLWDERNAHMAGYISGEAGADPLAQMRGGFTALHSA